MLVGVPADCCWDPFGTDWPELVVVAVVVRIGAGLEVKLFGSNGGGPICCSC